MAESLFQQLKKVGIDEELAHQVSASLDPDYNASKKDVLVMQEAILQMQIRSEQSHHELRSEIAEVKSSLRQEISEVSSSLQHEISEVSSSLQHEISEVSSSLRHEMTRVQSTLENQIHTNINRQFIVTFGGMLITIATVLSVNWYFH